MTTVSIEPSWVYAKRDRPESSTYDLWRDMVNQFGFMNQNSHREPPCFGKYGWVLWDDVYNLDNSIGRKAWKEATSCDDPIIPEDGEAWCDAFCEHVVKPALLEYLERTWFIK